MFITKLKPLLINCMSLSIALTMSKMAFAETTAEVISFHNKTPDSNELLDAFLIQGKQHNIHGANIAADGSLKPKILTRGISLKKKYPASNSDKLNKKVDKGSNACMAGSQSVAININFKSNSSQVKESDAELLINIAKAMNSPQLSNCYFVVEGHTDARGNDYYNLWLSQERANAVKAHLNGYNVKERRLVVVGKGESQLNNNDSPLSAENRRVEFRVINSIN